MLFCNAVFFIFSSAIFFINFFYIVESALKVQKMSVFALKLYIFFGENKLSLRILDVSVARKDKQLEEHSVIFFVWRTLVCATEET